MTVVKVYFPEEGTIQVHENRVCLCPSEMPIGFYWYGGNRKSQGRIPRWLLQMSEGLAVVENAEEEVPPEASDEEEDNAEVEKHHYHLREHNRRKAPTPIHATDRTRDESSIREEGDVTL